MQICLTTYVEIVGISMMFLCFRNKTNVDTIEQRVDDYSKQNQSKENVTGILKKKLTTVLSCGAMSNVTASCMTTPSSADLLK